MAGVVDLHERLSLFSEHWSPKVVARLNDYAVKVVKLKGEFVWHSHPETDELFLVVEGTLVIQLRDGPSGAARHARPWTAVCRPEGRRAPAGRGGRRQRRAGRAGDTVNTVDAGGPLTAVPEDLTAS